MNRHERIVHLLAFWIHHVIFSCRCDYCRMRFLRCLCTRAFAILAVWAIPHHRCRSHPPTLPHCLLPRCCHCANVTVCLLPYLPRAYVCLLRLRGHCVWAGISPHLVVDSGSSHTHADGITPAHTAHHAHPHPPPSHLQPPDWLPQWGFCTTLFEE